MLGEYVMKEYLCNFGSVDFIMCWDADKLLTGLVNNVKDGGVAVGRRKLFNEVEGNGMPWTWQNRELLNQSEWLVLQVLVPLAGDATVNKVLNVSMNVRPSIILLE